MDVDLSCTLKAGYEFGQSVSGSRCINAPVTRVWDVLSAPGQLSKYHPYCESNRVMGWPGVGSRDGVRYYSGLYFERDFVGWREGRGYDVQVGPPPRKSCLVTWDVGTKDADSCEIIIVVRPILESRLDDDIKRRFVTAHFGNGILIYLEDLLRGLDQFVTTGREVRRKQYGPHPIYAP
jgi:Polyketide cyclase / dehydrase and lipid transport